MPTNVRANLHDHRQGIDLGALTSSDRDDEVTLDRRGDNSEWNAMFDDSHVAEASAAAKDRAKDMASPHDRYRLDSDVGYEPWTPPGEGRLRTYPAPDHGHDLQLRDTDLHEVAPQQSGPVSSVSKSGLPTVDALLIGTKWGSGAVGTSVTVEYSFPANGAAWTVNYGPGTEPYSGFVPLSAGQQAAARKALQAWDEVSNLNFVEVADTGANVGDLRFGNSNVPNTAHAYYPKAGDPRGGDIWFGKNYDYSSDADGSYSLATFIHEIGHAIGLKHPHEAIGTGVTLSPNVDYLGNSIMSYRSYVGGPTEGGYTNSFFPTTPGILDIAAVQHLYGVNTTTRAGDTTYSWSPGEQLFETIWDAGGIDTIDWSNQSTSAYITLTSGVWSKLGPGYYTAGGLNLNTLNIAHGATIENARGGQAGDSIYGNTVANMLDGQGGNDYIFGDIGNDRLLGGGGNDTLDGWTENDTVGGGLGDDQLFGHDGNDTLAGGDGNDVLYGEQDNDRLTGGRGKDSLNGGIGYDVIDFNAKNESVIGTSRDIVVGFENVGALAGDLCDLADIDAKDGVTGNQAFTWRGTSAFSGSGQIRVYNSGSNTIVAGNTDADSAAEFEFAVNDDTFTAVNWTAADFVL